MVYSAFSMQVRNEKSMPEENDQTAADVAAAQAEAGAKATEDASGEQTPEEKKAAEDSAAAEADAKAKQEEEDNKEPDVKKRKTAKDFIIERQARKLAKKEVVATKKDDEEEEHEDEPDEGDVDEEDAKVIKKVLGKELSRTLAPILERQIAEEDEVEVQGFLAQNPDFKKYEAKARNYMKHPSRREVPIKAIFYEVAGDDLLKIGAERAKKANDDALRDSAGGGGGGSDDDNVSEIDAIKTPEQMAAYKEKVREKIRNK